MRERVCTPRFGLRGNATLLHLCDRESFEPGDEDEVESTYQSTPHATRTARCKRQSTSEESRRLRRLVLPVLAMLDQIVDNSGIGER